MTENKKKSGGLLAGVKEFFRKLVVSLKRNPAVIPLMMTVVCFLWYSLNLTHMSNTTAKIQGQGMGLAQFTLMLLSMLCFVCTMNAFPRRKKANIPMVVLVFVMIAVMFYCDIHYVNCIWAALTREGNPIVITEETVYIALANNMLGTHQILLGVTAVLVATLPLYTKLLKKINTTVEVEDNGSMGEIEITEE